MGRRNYGITAHKQYTAAVAREKRMKRQARTYRLKKLKEELQYHKILTGEKATPEEAAQILENIVQEEEKAKQIAKEKERNASIVSFLVTLAFLGIVGIVILIVVS